MRLLDGNQLRLYGSVGYRDPDGQGFTSVDVIDALAELGADTDVTVRINSGGGWAHEGVAIHTALAAHRGRVTVQVDAVALSAASLIAMAGETIAMATGSLMMIHDPSLVTIGTVEDHGRGIDQLRAVAESMATVYAARTGKSVASIRAAMTAETWMTADEAIAAGFADRAGAGKPTAAARFDHAAYSHVPWTTLAAMEAQARADSPEGRAGAAGWAKAAAKLNGAQPAKADPADERATAIRDEAKARGVIALGEDLIAGKLSATEALARLYRLPRSTAMTSAIAGVPSMADIAAGRAR